MGRRPKYDGTLLFIVCSWEPRKVTSAPSYIAAFSYRHCLPNNVERGTFWEPEPRDKSIDVPSSSSNSVVSPDAPGPRAP